MPVDFRILQYINSVGQSYEELTGQAASSIPGGGLGTWNFPVYTALSPVAGIFAAGNRAMTKLSELNPATAELLQSLIAQTFDPTELVAVTGGPEVGAEFAALPLDHIIFILNGEPFPFSSSDLALVIHTLIFATYGHVPLWLALNNPFYKAAQKRMNENSLKLVARVRQDPVLRENTLVGQYLNFPPPDELGAWRDDDLKIVPLAAYLAGFDTVASAAAFMLYRLLSRPDWLQRVREEYQQLSRESGGHVDPMKQKVLRAVFMETTRINPPGALVIRYAKQDFTFGDYTIRKGDEVLIQISSNHMNEKLFPDPEKFDPERFLGPDTTELKRTILTFGSGAHRCTGAMVGPLFSQEMVSYWVNNFDMELVPRHDKPKVVALPFTQPLGLRVRVLGRRTV